MNSNFDNKNPSENNDSEEIDLLSQTLTHATTSGQEKTGNDPETPLQTEELADETELKSLMSQLNPQAIKDIMAIEKGIEHYFLFHQSHLALAKKEQMKYLSSHEINTLEEKKVLVTFEYLLFNETSQKLELVTVLIRPASLKYDQVNKIKQGCIRGSVVAVLQYINGRDKNLMELEQNSALSSYISDQFIKVDKNGHSLSPQIREDLNILIKNLHTLSFEYLLGNIVPVCQELMEGIIELLSTTRVELIKILPEQKDIHDDALAALNARGNQPILFPISNDALLVNPDSTSLVKLGSDSVINYYSEIDWVHAVYVQLARKILLNILPASQNEWIESKGVLQDKRYLKELKHLVAKEESEWPNAPEFLQSFEILINKTRYLKNVRREFLLESVAEQSLNKLNMAFEPVLFKRNEFVVPESVNEVFEKDELFDAVMEKIKNRNDVLAVSEKRRSQKESQSGKYLIYAANLPRSFIQNNDRRHFLHLMAKENGYSNGIYSFLKNVSDDANSRLIVDEQIDLANSIREWEDDIEKERIKKELENLSFFDRLFRFIAGLFGIKTQDRREEDKSSREKTKKTKTKKEKNNRTNNRDGIIKGRPKEKLVKIPVHIQKAIDYVDRHNNGLIWLDQILLTLATTKYTDNQIGDMLHYDQDDRYNEVRALIPIRRIFLLQEKENDISWLRDTLDYLKNVSKSGSEYVALSEYIEQCIADFE